MSGARYKRWDKDPNFWSQEAKWESVGFEEGICRI